MPADLPDGAASRTTYPNARLREISRHFSLVSRESFDGPVVFSTKESRPIGDAPGQRLVVVAHLSHPGLAKFAIPGREGKRVDAAHAFP